MIYQRIKCFGKKYKKKNKMKINLALFSPIKMYKYNNEDGNMIIMIIYCFVLIIYLKILNNLPKIIY